jgi:hypothetical protein
MTSGTPGRQESPATPSLRPVAPRSSGELIPFRYPPHRGRNPCRRDTRMRTLVQRLKRLWNTPVEFYGVDRPEPQAGLWHGLLLFVLLLVVLGLLWLIRYLPERTYLVHDWPDVSRGAHTLITSQGSGAIVAIRGGQVAHAQPVWNIPGRRL